MCCILYTVYLIIDDSIHGHSDAVLGEDLLRRNIKGHRPQVNNLDGVHARDDEEEAGTNCSASLHSAQAEDHSSLVLLYTKLYKYKSKKSKSQQQQKNYKGLACDHCQETLRKICD